MNSRVVFVVIVTFVIALLGGLYGSIYDQVTYSICPEFFLNLRFEAFHVEDSNDNIRWNVAKIGFKNTYIFASFLGLILATVVSYFPFNFNKIKVVIQIFVTSLFAAILFAFIGYWTGIDKIEDVEGVSLNSRNIELIIQMNNYSKIGAVFGLFVNILYYIFKLRKNNELK